MLFRNKEIEIRRNLMSVSFILHNNAHTKCLVRNGMNYKRNGKRNGAEQRTGILKAGVERGDHKSDVTPIGRKSLRRRPHKVLT